MFYLSIEKYFSLQNDVENFTQISFYKYSKTNKIRLRRAKTNNFIQFMTENTINLHQMCSTKSASDLCSIQVGFRKDFSYGYGRPYSEGLDHLSAVLSPDRPSVSCSWSGRSISMRPL